MKKLALLVMMLANTMFANAQNYDTLYIQGMANFAQFHYCANEYDGVVIYGEPNWNCYWIINGETNYVDHILLQSNQASYEIVYTGGVNRHFYVSFHTPLNESPFTEPFVWKRQDETITLTVDNGIIDPYDYEWLWSNGSNEFSIDVTAPDTYSVTATSLYGCGSSTFSIQVRDNVEIYRAGVDPMTNKNKVRWNTTPEQAEYISSVKIERDGMVVGTAPYLDGEFLDNIGSENAARIYKITAIDTDGNECPLPSYQFGTFNTIISPDIANPSLMNFTWEDPFIEEGSPYSVVAYRIGRFNETTGEFTVIDQLSANVHLGKYNMDLFGGDYGIVAAVFNDNKGRDYEELAFSNRSDNEIVGIGETQDENFEVYPNPSNGVFTVKGEGTLRIANVLGQEIMAMEIDGKETVELPQGMYFVQLNGAVRKIVVE